LSRQVLLVAQRKSGASWHGSCRQSSPCVCSIDTILLVPTSQRVSDEEYIQLLRLPRREELAHGAGGFVCFPSSPSLHLRMHRRLSQSGSQSDRASG
jgi:hypothetical protein